MHQIPPAALLPGTEGNGNILYNNHGRTYQKGDRPGRSGGVILYGNNIPGCFEIGGLSQVQSVGGN